MKMDVVDKSGQVVEQVTLNPTIFQAPINPSLVAQAIRVRLINARTGTAHTKTRAEVSGGGRKPWRQKGTGRARHGSTRSPIWTGGGVTFGPRSHKPQAAMLSSMRRSALFSSLTDKVGRKELLVLSSFDLKQPRTKAIQNILQDLTSGNSALIVTPSKDQDLIQATRNLPKVKVMVASVLHPYEILKYKHVVVLKDSLSVIDQTFVTKDKSSKAEPSSSSQSKTGRSKSEAAKTNKSDVKASPDEQKKSEK